jgi:hypothetical protein
VGKALLLLDATLYQPSVLFMLELIAVHGLQAKGFRRFLPGIGISGTIGD